MPAIKADRALGLFLVVAGAGLFWHTFSFRTVDWDPLGLAFWPRIVLAFIIAFGAWLTLRGSLDGGSKRRLEAGAFLVAGGFLAYVFLLPVLGFLVATPLYIFLFHLTLGGLSARCAVEALISAALGTAAIFLVFQEGLLVQFPEGLMAERL